MSNNPISVLVIEDDLVDQMAIKSAVTKQNLPYQLKMAPSVAEAKRLLTSESFDVILADFQLGDGTSFELFDLFKDQLVIFTTGCGDERTAVSAMQSGARDYMIKDPDRHYLQLLSQRIEKALRDQALERQAKETEFRYREVVEGSSELIFTAAPDGRIQFANKAWLKTLGYTLEEALQLNLFHVSEVPEPGIGSWLEQEKLGLIQTHFITKDGRTVKVEGTAEGRVERGVPLMLRGIFRDVSERIRFEVEREELVTKLQTALSAIPVCLAPALQKTREFERLSKALLENIPRQSGGIARDLAESLKNSALSNAEVMLDLMCWAELQLGNLEPQPESHPLLRAASFALTTVEAEGQKKNLHITLDIPEDLMVYCDQRLSETILRNLLRRGIEVTPQDGHIRIMGISDDTEVTVSMLYQEGKNADSAAKPSLDLSLMITREMVAKNRGRFWDQNLEGILSWHYTIPIAPPPPPK